MNLKETLDKAALTLGLFLMFGILFIPELRIGVGNIVGLLLNPLLNEPIKLPFHMILFILATLTGLYASWIQKYTMDWKLMKRVQERMKAFQKEFKETQLSGNAQKLKKLEAQRNEMMADQMAMTKQQFKPMLYISIISIPLFMWAYSAIIHTPEYSMIFPFWGEQKLSGIVFWVLQYWIYWYFICSLPVSQIIRKSLNIGGM